MPPAPISVILPAHNAARFIRESIESVQSQTLRVTEIIVIADDCSDETSRIAESMGVIVLEERRHNASAARNTGIRESSQEWIAFIDADDRWVSNKIELQWKVIQACPDVGIVATDYYYLRGQDVTQRPKGSLGKVWDDYADKRKIGRRGIYVPQANADLFSRIFFFSSSVIMRREAISTVGLFDEDLIYNQDFEFFMRMLARYPFAFIEQPLFYYRIHDQNLSRDAKGKWQAHISIVNLMLKHPENYPAGAGQFYRDEVKDSFHVRERLLAHHLRPDGTYSLEIDKARA